jgi:hypothetical protein
MNCVQCRRAAPVRAQPWTEEDNKELRRQSWYVWPHGAPVRYHGLVLCRGCRRGATAELLIRCAEEDTHPTENR